MKIASRCLDVMFAARNLKRKKKKVKNHQYLRELPEGTKQSAELCGACLQLAASQFPKAELHTSKRLHTQVQCVEILIDLVLVLTFKRGALCHRKIDEGHDSFGVLRSSYFGMSRNALLKSVA